MSSGSPRSTSRFATLAVLVALASVATAAAAEGAPPQLAASAKTIVLVRHGAYDDDPKADPVLGPGLTPLGVAQARLAGARLAGLPFDFDAVLASPLTRAQETARVIADDLARGFDTVGELAECTPPTWRSAIVADEKPEEMAACAARLDRFFSERFRPATGVERRELLVCHGNVIRYLVTKALHVDPMAWLEMSIGHTSLTVVRVEADGTFKVIAVGDVGHIPPNLQTGSTGQPSRSLAVPAAPAKPPGS